MLLAFFLAPVMPLLIEGTRIFPEIHTSFAFAAIGFALPLLLLIGFTSVIATISFYASTLSRNTLQSLAPAVLGIIITFIFFNVPVKAERLFPFPLS